MSRGAPGAARPRLDDFQHLGSLGRGTIGRVHKVRHKETGSVYALKTISKQFVLNKELGHQLLAEVSTQSKLRHRNLLRCLGCFEDPESVFLVLEYAPDGDLAGLLRRHGPLDEPRAAHVFAQVAEGVRYLHSQNTIHRDLKPENILLGPGLHAKVCDFGWCAQAEGRTTFCGTPCMLAPEILMGKAYDGGVDTWALGLVLYEMLTARSPFHAAGSLAETRKVIVATDIDDALLERVPAAASSLISSLLHRDVSRRIALRDAVRHSWVVVQRSRYVVAQGPNPGEDSLQEGCVRPEVSPSSGLLYVLPTDSPPAPVSQPITTQEVLNGDEFGRCDMQPPSQRKDLRSLLQTQEWLPAQPPKTCASATAAGTPCASQSTGLSADIGGLAPPASHPCHRGLDLDEPRMFSTGTLLPDPFEAGAQRNSHRSERAGWDSLSIGCNSEGLRSPLALSPASTSGSELAFDPARGYLLSAMDMGPATPGRCSKAPPWEQWSSQSPASMPSQGVVPRSFLFESPDWDDEVFSPERGERMDPGVDLQEDSPVPFVPAFPSLLPKAPYAAPKEATRPLLQAPATALQLLGTARGTKQGTAGKRPVCGPPVTYETIFLSLCEKAAQEATAAEQLRDAAELPPTGGLVPTADRVPVCEVDAHWPKAKAKVRTGADASGGRSSPGDRGDNSFACYGQPPRGQVHLGEHLPGEPSESEIAAWRKAAEEASSSRHPLVVQVMQMGFSRSQAHEAVRRASTVEAAVDWLVHNGLQ